MIVSCDKCNQSFLAQLYKTNIEGNLYLFFLQCPSCGERTKALVESEQLKILKEQIQRLRRKRTEQNYEEIEKQIKKKQKKYSSIEKQLERKYKKQIKEILENGGNK